LRIWLRVFSDAVLVGLAQPLPLRAGTGAVPVAARFSLEGAILWGDDVD
jgi:hypothetical protein